MEENNLVKENEEIIEEVVEEIEAGEELEEILEVKNKKLGFFTFLLGNILDLIAILFLSLAALAIAGLILKALGFYVKERTTLYLVIVPAVLVLYNTIMETKMGSTFGKIVFGFKLKK